MQWWIVLALVLLGSLAWCWTRWKAASEDRQANGRRQRLVSDVAKDAGQGKVRVLSTRPVPEEEPARLFSDVTFRIDQG